MDIRKTIVAAGAVICLFAGGLYAVNIKLIGPCSEKPVLEKNFEIKDFKKSAFKISAEIFTDNGISYESGDDGFTSLLGAPSGADAMERVEPGKLRVYGWCFTVNGILPEVMPGDFYFKKPFDRIVWFYGYSTYYKSEWTDYCAPAYKVKPAKFCADDKKDLSVNISSDLSEVTEPDAYSAFGRLVNFDADWH